MAVVTTTLILREATPIQDYGYPEFSVRNVWRLAINLKPYRHQRE